MMADGEWVPEAQSRAVILLDDLLEEFVTLWDIPGVEEDPTEMILDALASIDTPKSSDFLYLALIIGLAETGFVAETLADRGDLRCLRAVVEEMLRSPESYFLHLRWLESMEKKVASLLDHPFELAWLEALLVEDEILQELSFDVYGRYQRWRNPPLDSHSALEAIVDVCSANRSALRLFLWLMLLAWVDHDNWSRSPTLLEGAIFRLIEIDPTVLAELVTDDVPLNGLFGFDVLVFEDPHIAFAERLLKTSASLLDALPHDLKHKFWPTGKPNNPMT